MTLPPNRISAATPSAGSGLHVRRRGSETSPHNRPSLLAVPHVLLGILFITCGQPKHQQTGRCLCRLMTITLTRVPNQDDQISATWRFWSHCIRPARQNTTESNMRLYRYTAYPLLPSRTPYFVLPLCADNPAVDVTVALGSIVTVYRIGETGARAAWTGHSAGALGGVPVGFGAGAAGGASGVGGGDRSRGPLTNRLAAS
jgi:hypothetical protein